MSLINDALKKAQRQRGDPEPAPGIPSPASLTGAATPPHPPRRKPPGFESQMLVIGGGAAVVIVALVVALVVVLRDKDTPQLAHKSPETGTQPNSINGAADTPPTRTEPTLPQPHVTAQPVPAPSATASTPTTTPASNAPQFTIDPAPVAQADNTRPGPPQTSAPATGPSLVLPEVGSQATAQATPEAGERATTPPRASSAMANAIESYRVAGIRASGSDPRVLMNDRVFRVNDMIDHVLGIRLTGVESDQLIFTDVETGATYVRHF